MKEYLKLPVTALAICLFAACSEKNVTETHERTVSVKVINIATSVSAYSRSYVGTVEESVAVSLSFPGTGTVEQAFVSEGQTVSKGQLLATLNAATAQNACDATQAKLAQAQDAYDRLKKVYENGSLPEIKFAEMEAGLQQAKSMAAISKKSLDDCKMYAPSNGVIAARNIEPGASAMPGVAAFKLILVDKVNVKISVPENEIGKLAGRQTATVVVPALDNAVFTGKVEMKGVAANALSHTYEAKIGVANSHKALMPGMVCKVSLDTGESADEIIVPNLAIQISADNRHFVWLADNNVAKRQFVKTGKLTDNGIAVTGGLSAGDKVIVEGMSKISEGMRLKCD